MNVSRVANAARFAVPDAARPLIEGKRVLLVLDLDDRDLVAVSCCPAQGRERRGRHRTVWRAVAELELGT